MNILERLSQEMHLSGQQTDAIVRLIDEGNTIPFIARYRKEMTGGADDETLRALDERLKYLRGLEVRKEEVLASIENHGALTEELRQAILEAQVLQRVEDLYRPYKQKRRTRATQAKERGLEPLADWLMDLSNRQADEAALLAYGATFADPESEVPDVESALSGARDILAERMSDDPDLRQEIRKAYQKTGKLRSKASDPLKNSVYETYYDFEEAIRTLPSHRILAIDRAEKEEFLKVTLEIDETSLLRMAEKRFIGKQSEVQQTQIRVAIEDGLKRLLLPSVEREIRSELTERAQEEAIRVFAVNTKPLLMQAPVKGKTVLAIDPAYRTGCKVAVLDELGRLLDKATIYPTKPHNDIEGARKVLLSLIKKHQVDLISIGNGTGSRETEQFVGESIKTLDKPVHFTIVSEAGASVYSASKLATEEYPDLDVTTRGAISIGRRLQDPMAELVKIDPKSIGVGQYQHDLNPAKLDDSLRGVVESCVNAVGVDLNVATPSLLQYVAGIGGTLAKSIVAHREENGKFRNRKALLKVKRLGPKAYVQCAGFLRIADGDEPLDATSVHPESYEACRALLKTLGLTLDETVKMDRTHLFERLLEITQKKSPDQAFAALSEITGAGVPTLKDIVEELLKPGRDPREDMPGPVFRSDVLSMEDLELGMVMKGTVRNVVNFGAFVDIGVKTDGLVHVSQIADRFVKDPMEVVRVGDAVDVRVIGIDRERNKISLSMKKEKMAP
jgi:uncharacterized protein